MGQTYQSIVVSAPIDKVWAKLRNFHDMSWTAVIEKLEVIGDKAPDQPGARRHLNGVFKETLLGIDDENHVVTYSIDEAPGTPVAEAKNYRGAVRAFPVTHGDQTFVEWSSRWDQNADACAEFCSGVYNGFLGHLKEHFD